VMEGETGDHVGGELESVTSSAGCFRNNVAQHCFSCVLGFILRQEFDKKVIATANRSRVSIRDRRCKNLPHI